jgi:putative thioredoxin
MQSLIGQPPSESSGDARTSAAPGELVKDSDIQSFRRDVLEASMAQPVLVDFWAPWCGPCKQLTPALEKAVLAARGAVKLVKIDIDQNQQIAQQLRIASVPTVYAFYQGQPVDGFQGALPESQIKAFIDQLIEAAGGQPNADIEALLEQAEQLRAGGQIEQAAALYQQAVGLDPENVKAIAGLLRCRLDLGDSEGVSQAMESLSEELRATPELASIQANLDLAAAAAESGDAAELRARLSADENDHEARFALAQACYAAGQREEAAEALLEILRRQRDWNEEAARKELLKYFEAWGPSDPLTLATRRRLSSLLFA